MKEGGPVLLDFGVGLTCDQTELKVVTNLPFDIEPFDYDTKTKEQGQDHVWGEISKDGKPIATIDFWEDSVDFWREGENGFGWIPDEDQPPPPPRPTRVWPGPPSH